MYLSCDMCNHKSKHGNVIYIKLMEFSTTDKYKEIKVLSIFYLQCNYFYFICKLGKPLPRVIFLIDSNWFVHSETVMDKTTVTLLYMESSLPTLYLTCLMSQMSSSSILAELF